MQDFNLERSLAAWRKEVIRQKSMEPETIAEIEAGLLDRYDELLIRGYQPAEAFAEASERTITLSLPEQEAPGNRSAAWALAGNYIKIARRNLRARRWYNLTNFITLCLGIATAAIAILYLNYETSYDSHIPDANRKYRVGMTMRAQGYSMIGFRDYGSTTDQLQQIEGFANIPGIEQGVQFASFPDPILIKSNERELPVEHLLRTNTPTDFLEYFDVQMLTGNREDLAAAPNQVVLTESLATRYFGSDWEQRQLTDKVISIDTNNYAIVGVVADPRPSTHFTYSAIINSPSVGYWGARTYVKLAEGADAATVKQRIEADMSNINTRLATSELFGGILLQPIAAIHLQSNLLYELKPPGDVRYLYIIGLIALIILLLSISNYTNLTIVMNAGRAREIGMRKVFGATQSQIAGQFLLEAIILSLLTLPVVLAGLWFLLPHFNALMGTEISRGLITNPLLLLAFIGLTVSIGLLAGGYPAFVLARTRVQGLFRGRMIRDSSGKLSTRKVIMTGQFILLIGLCSLTLFVNRQLNYIQDKDLGYRKENILYVPVRTDSSRFATFRNEVSKLPGVVSVGSGSRMGQNPYNQLTYQLKGTDQVFNDAYNLSLDYQAIGQLGVQTSVPQYVADPDQAPDPLILINETLANRLKNRFQLTDAELIGRYLIQEPEYVDEESGEIGFPYPIAGTFADLHVFSLRESIDPMFLTVYRNPRYVYDASIQFEGLSRAELLAAVKQPYDALSFSQPFTPSFLSDNLDQLYQAEVRISVLSTCISIVAFLLALIGLVALTAYLTASKKKEIGIRLILGAGTADILKRFNLEYVPLLLTAAVITVPLAWWSINLWLKGFAYRIAIDGYVFAFAVVIVGVIASIAVSAITLRAARAVPADALANNG